MVRLKNTKTPLQLEIDEISEEGLDIIRLSERLTPIKEMLAKLPQDSFVAHLEYMQDKLRLKPDFIRAIRNEIKALKSIRGSSDDEQTKLSAQFPQLVDLVIDGEQIAYLYKTKEGPKVGSTYNAQNGETLIPPPDEAIPFDLSPADKVLFFYNNDEDESLYWDLLSKLKTISILPSDEIYHLCSVYSFFTYIAEASPYYPYLWFFGLPERGKSRIVKALVNLCYRGLYTETLNEAYLFRFADRFRGTLGLDLYELSERAQKRGSHDLLLGRYERGVKVARVTAPDKGAFRDTDYFAVSGPTVIATNIEIPSRDPLQSRCIKITMPEARGIYANNNSNRDLRDLRARLLAFRLRHLGELLPDLEKPTAGRLGDIIHPLLCVATLLPKEGSEALTALIADLEVKRKDAEAESLAGRIAQVLYELRQQVENGRLPVEKVREKINEGINERYHTAAQTIGRELSAMGIERKKSGGKMQVIFNPKVMENIWARYALYEDNLPDLPYVPKASGARDSEREILNRNLPDVLKNREEREEAKNNLPAVEPYQSTDREIREEREITPRDNEQQSLFIPEEVII